MQSAALSFVAVLAIMSCAQAADLHDPDSRPFATGSR